MYGEIVMHGQLTRINIVVYQTVSLTAFAVFVF